MMGDSAVLNWEFESREGHKDQEGRAMMPVSFQPQ